jgi:hypothetical protein
MQKVVEMSRVSQHKNMWCVEIFSAAIARWIVQGEFVTKRAALADLVNWR